MFNLLISYSPESWTLRHINVIEAVQYRARQNVVFEHGYLFGKLGRPRVSAVVKGAVETPNDISGVVYVGMDPEGSWQEQLKIEMRGTGYHV